MCVKDIEKNYYTYIAKDLELIFNKEEDII